MKYANIMTRIITFRAILVSAFLFFWGMHFCPSVAWAGPDKIMLYFYSSETNINNFKSLKMEFDGYLSSIGPYEFQPFRHRKIFEKYVKDKKKCLLLLSSWHYSNIYREYSLKPALVGVRKGKKYQRRLLVGKDGNIGAESLKTGRIASASSILHTRNTLTEMFKDKKTAEAAKILTVPKDIDALMSVGFGMSQYALTTRSSLDKLKAVNSVLHKKMKIIAEGKESLLLILAFPKTFMEEGGKVVKIIQDMPANPDGKKKIKMFGLDGWQQIDSSDNSKLEG